MVTVAEVATVLNAVLFTVSVTFTLSIAVILVVVLQNVNSAVTWSVVMRDLHRTLWPTILRADSNSSHGVSRSILIISKFSLLGSLLVTLAGVITPLGLHQELSTSSPKSASLVYVADTSPLGQSTIPRTNYTLNRICGAIFPIQCPGSQVTLVNGSITDVTSAIPQNITDVFSSAPHSTFNMQFRQFYQDSFHSIDSGKPYDVGNLAIQQSQVSRTGIFALEGVVVDMDNPGIGLWNHSLPTSPSLGGTWTQDMLWLEPQSVCVDSNMTIDYACTSFPCDVATPFNLTDRGGFTNLPHDYPGPLDRNGQDINLYQHAWKGANLWLGYMVENLNITRKETYIGKAFPLNTSTLEISVGQFQFNWPAWLPTEFAPINDTNVTSLGDLQVLCQGFGGQDFINLTNVDVHCDFLLGIPRRTDGGDPRVQDLNSTWQQSMYFCASTTRARIQRVTFSSSVGAGATLDSLTITRQNTNTSILWGLENTGLHITDADPFWGPIADQYESDPNLYTLRKEWLYLPAAGSSSWGAADSTHSVYSIGGIAWSSLSGGLSFGDIYNGANNAQLRTTWTQLGSSPSSSTMIKNLIWTDIMANNVVGAETATVGQVSPHKQSVGYHLGYGVPGILLLLVWTPLIGVTVFCFATGRITATRLREVMDQTSVGRAVTAPSTMPTKQWIEEGDGLVPLALVHRDVSGERTTHLAPLNLSTPHEEKAVAAMRESATDTTPMLPQSDAKSPLAYTPSYIVDTPFGGS